MKSEDGKPFQTPQSWEMKGPNKVQEACWIAWQESKNRAAGLTAENTRLSDDLRKLDRKNGVLEERVWAMRNHQRLSAAISSWLLGLASILGGVTCYIFSLSDQEAHFANRWGVPAAILTLLFLAGGGIVQWLPSGSSSKTRVSEGSDHK